ncbi:GNAT family N-acetyltransferase [Paenibacillus sp. KN14-4R]|uniref:GNAT family N-acetyltransferase n=1 Tax=Paenibacillus sp. KN14-4R TaxID=3445773 RepID=UPI003FA02A45
MTNYQTVLKENGVTLRSITEEDFPTLYQLIYCDKEPEWKKWDAPYFPLKFVEYDEYVEKITKSILLEKDGPESQLLIEVDGEIIGTVSYYWEHQPSNWLEVGIVIYTPQYWSGGYGTDALRAWITHLFNQMPLARVGLTTWSGNYRMMRAAEKVGMQLEGRMRKCRIYQGEYYDSIRMGVLREEWFEGDSACR